MPDEYWRNTFPSGLASDSEDSDIVIPEKGLSSEAGHLLDAGRSSLCCGLASASVGVRPNNSPLIASQRDTGIPGASGGEAPLAAGWPDDRWRSLPESAAVRPLVDSMLRCSLEASVYVTDASVKSKSKSSKSHCD